MIMGSVGKGRETLGSASTLQLTRAEPWLFSRVWLWVPSSLCMVTFLWVTETLGLGIVPAWVLLRPSLLSVPVGAGVA